MTHIALHTMEPSLCCCSNLEFKRALLISITQMISQKGYTYRICVIIILHCKQHFTIKIFLHPFVRSKYKDHFVFYIIIYLHKLLTKFFSHFSFRIY